MDAMEPFATKDPVRGIWGAMRLSASKSSSEPVSSVCVMTSVGADLNRTRYVSVRSRSGPE